MKIPTMPVMALCIVTSLSAQTTDIEITLSTDDIVVRDMFTVLWDAGTNRPPYGDYIALYPSDALENTPPLRGFPKFTARTSSPMRNVIIGATGEYEFRHVRRVSSAVYNTLSSSGTFFVREPVVNPNDITNYPAVGTTVALGDSLTLGTGSTEDEDYVSELMRRLGCPAEIIINAGVSGDTTGDALERLQTDVLAHNPGLVIILLGPNDIRLRVPNSTTYNNLSQIVSQCHASGSVVVLVGWYQRISSLFSYSLNDKFAELAQTHKRVAEENGCAYVPNVMSGLIGNFKLMDDSVHPNDAGYDIVAKRLAGTVDLLLGDGPPLTINHRLLNQSLVQLSFRLVPGKRYEIMANDELPLISGIARVSGDGNFVFEVIPNNRQYFFGVKTTPGEDTWLDEIGSEEDTETVLDNILAE